MSEPYYGWHLDKRVSVGHIVSTVAVTAAVVFWMFRLEGRVAVNEVNISNLAAVVAASRTERQSQYTEIIRRLERIDDRLIADEKK